MEWCELDIQVAKSRKVFRPKTHAVTWNHKFSFNWSIYQDTDVTSLYKG